MDNWRSQAKRLSVTRPIITLNLRNHGDSPHIKGMSYREMYEREFIRLFGYHQFDRIVEFNGYRTFWVSLFAFAKVKQKVIYLHSDMYNEYKLRFPSLPIVFNLYKYFDKLISVSESSLISNKEKLINDYSLREEQFIYINNPLDIDGYKTLSNEILDNIAYKQFIEDKNIKFISVGRLSPEKGQIKLIKAFIELCKSEKNISLYLIGYGPLEDKFRKIIQEHGLEKNIFLLGHQSNPFPFFKNADCKLLSSDYEGQSLVLLEALCLNLPCISTNIPGPRSILEGGYGILCGENVEEIIEAIKTFLTGDIVFKHFDEVEYNNKALKMFYELK